MRSFLLSMLCTASMPCLPAAEPAPEKVALGPREVTVQVSGAGMPVQGAMVFVRRPVAFDERAEGRLDVPILTGADGRVSIPFPDDRALLMVFAKHFAPAQKVIPSPKADEIIEIALNEGIPFKARFMWRNGTPIAESPIFFDKMPSVHDFYVFNLKDRPLIGTTDAEGWLTWTHAPKGIFILGLPSWIGGIVPWMFDSTQDSGMVVRLRSDE